MNFAIARSKYKGKLNLLAYWGMLGDVAVLITLYGVYRYRKDAKVKKEAIRKVKEREDAIAFFPPKTEQMDYNYMSPYTPIPYHASKRTKFQHYHIDLVGYLNERHLNVEKGYYRYFHHNDKSKVNLSDWHDPYNLVKSHGDDGHGHGHH